MLYLNASWNRGWVALSNVMYGKKTKYDIMSNYMNNYCALEEILGRGILPEGD